MNQHSGIVSCEPLSGLGRRRLGGKTLSLRSVGGESPNSVTQNCKPVSCHLVGTRLVSNCLVLTRLVLTSLVLTSLVLTSLVLTHLASTRLGSGACVESGIEGGVEACFSGDPTQPGTTTGWHPCNHHLSVNPAAAAGGHCGCLGLLEVCCGMTLRNPLFFRAPGAIHPPTSGHRGPGFDRRCPSNHVLVGRHL